MDIGLGRTRPPLKSLDWGKIEQLVKQQGNKENLGQSAQAHMVAQRGSTTTCSFDGTLPLFRGFGEAGEEQNIC